MLHVKHIRVVRPSCLCNTELACGAVVHTPFRKRIRQKYGIREGNDCCATTFCCPCAICQEANEIEYQIKMGVQPQTGMHTMAPQQHAPMTYGGQQGVPQGVPVGQHYPPPPPSGAVHY